MTNTPTTRNLDAQIQTQIGRRSMGRHARPGFSMIELVAVLVILGLLMAGAAVAIPGQIKRAKIRVTKTSMTTLKVSLNNYITQNNGTAPATLAELIPDYIEKGSEVDSWKNAYYYAATPGTDHSFNLVSKGPDGQISTADDINIWTLDVTTSD
mgnify:CR=1 FL=1